MSIGHVPTVIPRRFEPTHQTDGLPGYPAIDIFGPWDHLVRLADHGRVRRISGKSPCRGGVPGGAAGYSLYVEADDGSDWFLTHFGVVLVRVGQRVTPSLFLGAPMRSSDGPAGWSEHIHAGRKPGQSLDTRAAAGAA